MPLKHFHMVLQKGIKSGEIFFSRSIINLIVCNIEHITTEVKILKFDKISLRDVVWGCWLHD